MRHASDWLKSSYSAGASNACVEVCISPRRIDLRDSTHPTGPVLTFDDVEWNAFLRGQAVTGRPAERHSRIPSSSSAASRPLAVSSRTASYDITQ
ncbi:DUF397 domain-containing protein [Nocardiopsis gilva]|uniref:DUF397 domain-containing protein n=1 Tax=Nocardiopsis gilva TaxID=280236 RepID=UPI001268B1EA